MSGDPSAAAVSKPVGRPAWGAAREPSAADDKAATDLAATGRDRRAELEAQHGALPAINLASSAAPSRRRGALLRRVIAALVIAPPVLAGVYAGGIWFVLGTTLVTALALREFYSLSSRPGAKLLQPLGFLLALLLLLGNGGRDLLQRSIPAPALGGGMAALADLLRPDRLAYLARLSLAAAIIMPLIALLFERHDLRGRLVGWALTLAGTLYVAWLMSHFQALRLVGGDDVGRGWVFYALAATWVFDSGAYLVGSRLGKHRFMTWISPKKTWEGAVGGFLLCLLVTAIARAPITGGLLVSRFGWAPLSIPLWHVPFLALAVSAAAQFGDLAESMIKREAGAKDASELIPGHGGMLDRIDSLLFTVVLVYYYAVVIASP